jgi:hypothetical protein
MKRPLTISDQSNNWSARDLYQHVRSRFIQAFRQGAANSPSQAHRALAALGVAFAGFGDRTLQALWKCRLPLSARAGTWAEVLSLGELSQKSPQDDIRARDFLGIGAGVLGTFHGSRRDAQGCLRHQPGVVAASRTLRRINLTRDTPCCHDATRPNCPDCPDCDQAAGRRAGGGRDPRRNACGFLMSLHFHSKFNRTGQ